MASSSRQSSTRVFQRSSMVCGHSACYWRVPEREKLQVIPVSCAVLTPTVRTNQPDRRKKDLHPKRLSYGYGSTPRSDYSSIGLPRRAGCSHQPACVCVMYASGRQFQFLRILFRPCAVFLPKAHLRVFTCASPSRTRIGVVALKLLALEKVEKRGKLSEIHHRRIITPLAYRARRIPVLQYFGCLSTVLSYLLLARETKIGKNRHASL